MVVHSSTKIFQIGCLIALLLSSASTLDAATVADVVTRLGGLNAQHKREVLVKGAQAEGELVCYGTILVNEFGALVKSSTPVILSLISALFRTAPGRAEPVFQRSARRRASRGPHPGEFELWLSTDERESRPFVSGAQPGTVFRRNV